MPNTPVPATGEAMPVAVETTESALERFERLTFEIGGMLDEYYKGRFAVLVYPNSDEFSGACVLVNLASLKSYANELTRVMATRLSGMTARERPNYHAEQYARAAREIDPTATELWRGEAVDDDNPQRFNLIVARKQGRA